ncbi:MAG: hypothetical protein N2C14_15400, partial [Planctomycetales bacterium]
LDGEIKKLKEAKAKPEAVAALKTEQDAASLKALQLMDWRTIWMIPAVGAGVIMILFAIVFKDEKPDPFDEMDEAEEPSSNES